MLPTIIYNEYNLQMASTSKIVRQNVYSVYEANVDIASADGVMIVSCD